MLSLADDSRKTRTDRRKIATFWLPLYSTWLMMSVEGPFIAAIIARLADAKFNLAAYGVAFSLGMIFESPIIMMLSAANVLVKDRRSFLKLRRFNNVLNVTDYLGHAAGFDSAGVFLVDPRPDRHALAVARLTHLATMFLLPWPAAIGYRRFYQGILIGNKLPRRVAYGTIVRLSSMAATALLLYLFSACPAPVSGRPPCPPAWSWKPWPAVSWPGSWSEICCPQRKSG